MAQDIGLTIPYNKNAERKKQREEDADYLLDQLENLLPMKKLKELKIQEIQKKFLKDEKGIKTLLETKTINKNIAKFMLSQNKEIMRKKKTEVKDKYYGMEDYISTLGDWLPDSVKADLEIQDLNKKSEERLKAIDELLRANIVTPDRARYLKIKNKLTLQYEKFFIKQKWFKQVTDKLTGLGRAISDGAGSWFWKIITFLSGMAIFDPEGKYLNKIIDAIGKALSTLFGKMNLGKFIDNFFNVITKVMPNIVKKIYDSVAGYIQQFLMKFRNLFPKDSMTYKILDTITSWFGANGVITDFFHNIAKYTPQILAILLALGTLDKIGPQIVAIIGALKDAFIALSENKALQVLLGGVALGIGKTYFDRWKTEKQAQLGKKIDEGLAIGAAKVKDLAGTGVSKVKNIFSNEDNKKESSAKTKEDKKKLEDLRKKYEDLKKKSEERKRSEEKKAEIIKSGRAENAAVRPKILSRPKIMEISDVTKRYAV